MATKPDQEKPTEAPHQAVSRIRITLTSTLVKALEKVCQEFTRAAKDNKVDVKGPVHLPTKTLRTTTRKTPCGEGSKTWDRYQMRIHKRIIDLNCTQEMIKKITQVGIVPGVDIDFTISNE